MPSITRTSALTIGGQPIGQKRSRKTYQAKLNPIIEAVEKTTQRALYSPSTSPRSSGSSSSEYSDSPVGTPPSSSDVSRVATAAERVLHSGNGITITVKPEEAVLPHRLPQTPQAAKPFVQAAIPIKAATAKPLAPQKTRVLQANERASAYVEKRNTLSFFVRQLQTFCDWVSGSGVSSIKYQGKEYLCFTKEKAALEKDIAYPEADFVIDEATNPSTSSAQAQPARFVMTSGPDYQRLLDGDETDDTTSPTHVDVADDGVETYLVVPAPVTSAPSHAHNPERRVLTMEQACHEANNRRVKETVAKATATFVDPNNLMDEDEFIAQERASEAAALAEAQKKAKPAQVVSRPVPKNSPAPATHKPTTPVYTPVAPKVTIAPIHIIDNHFN